jgi:KaiC/GvpD/RAD55 family RecA-like ATPase
MPKHLSKNFLYELFKLCFVKKSILEVVKTHLSYQYIPVELKELKLILQSINSQYELNGNLPSYGIISQQFIDKIEVQVALQKIKESDIIDSELMLKQLFTFIKDVKFQLIFQQSVDAYNSDKKEEALEIFMKGAEELSNYTLKSSEGQFIRVFQDFHMMLKESQHQKDTGADLNSKVPFGIDVLDILTEGGLDKGDIAVWIMPSGVGKSTALKWTAMYACRLGYDVLHVQLEGGKKEVYDKYTQIWTGSTYSDIKWGNIPREKMLKIEKVIDDVNMRHRDLYIYSFEKFGEASMVDIRDLIMDYHKIKGKFPDLLVIDSMDLVTSGTNKKIDTDPAYKKEKLQTSAQRFKDICVEFDIAGLTATQTSNVPKEKWNNPDFVITREHTEGDRTFVKPFSYVFTGNQTLDEKKKDFMRINIDKFRFYSIKDSVYPICSSYDFGKFYDRKRSLKEFSHLYEPENATK